MKKIFGIILSASMLLSIVVIFTVPASAVEGMWEVYGVAGDYRDDFDGEEDQYHCIPGYSYVYGEGLKVTPAGWTISSPRVGIQTKEKIDMRNGVYMLVRVDEFSYEAGDKWFSFNIYDTKYVSVGSVDKAKDGEGITTLIRPDNNGKISGVAWREANFQSSGSNVVDPNFVNYDDEGHVLLALEITWSAAKGYSVNINGAPITDTALAWMNTHFADGMAYIGFNMQNSLKGGTAACTVLKYGESKATAIAPMGDDSAPPVYVDDEYTPAPIADPSLVPEGQPAIILNGNRFASDSKSTVKDTEFNSLTEENYIHVISDRTQQMIGMSVKNSVSYDIDDFPVLLVLTRNLCTCPVEDFCFCFESCALYIMAGDDIAASDDRSIRDVNANEFANGEAIEIDGDSYLYFCVDASEEAGWDADGRINSIRFDISQIDITTPGKNEFDVCFAAFFRSKDEAAEYVSNFLGLDDVEDTQETEDTAPSETEGREDVTDEFNTDEGGTQESGGQESQTCESQAQETQINETEPVVTPEETDKQTEANNAGNNTASAGCSGTVGFGVIAMITLAAGVSFVAFKKKK